YESVDAFLDGDAWTVERADILLVGAESLALDTAVRFDISLLSGPPIVVGEGKVSGVVEAVGDRGAGLRVKLQKLNGASKDVLKRALDAQRKKSITKATPPAGAVPSSPEAPVALPTAPEQPPVEVPVEAPTAAADTASTV